MYGLLIKIAMRFTFLMMRHKEWECIDLWPTDIYYSAPKEFTHWSEIGDIPNELG